MEKEIKASVVSREISMAEPTVNKKQEFKKLCLLLALSVPLVIYTGFVASKLWEWFISSTFNTVTLSVSEAAGLTFLIGYLTTTLKRKSEPYGSLREIYNVFYRRMLYHSLSLAIGYIIYLYM